jgi:para-aminobenzoate synthetase component 1
MSMLFKFKHLWMIGNSPERFLQKTASTLISQTIKGTIARGKTKEQDQEQIESLKHSEKNQAENVMIVDLVRNDLNRCCIPGSVQVPELFGIHSFSKVHHMISTISGELEFPEDTWKPLRDTFPPGSMTGAPKIMAMELITREEPVARGWYSGATGYFTPEGDFDFAVVIRSFIYDSQKELLTYNSGGAITWDSDPKEEYEEMLVKASAVLEGLTSKTP